MELVSRRSSAPLGDLKVKFEPPFEALFDIGDISAFFTCKVRILVVTDSGAGGFGSTQGFHLGKVLDIVQNDAWPHVQFIFTKAHRQVGDGDIDNFRFDARKLEPFDAIWLFGIETSQDPLSGSELRALSEFMKGGGGVFATGDHEQLGKPMAAEVPRVRSMRRWHWPSPGPDGEPVAPDAFGTGRHDTLVDANGVPSEFGSQVDEVPQTIRPRFYGALSLGPLGFGIVRFPHPVLCGPKGPIRHLPDHMHEGHCEVPSDLTQTFAFDGERFEEYPGLNGHQEKPQVIAWANNNATSTEFGVLGAYDGHRSGVGRVVVDATWHHWFNINLDGFIAATDPGSPSFDPAAVPAWEEIKSYFRNVAAWLAPPKKQQCMRNGAWFVLLKNTEVAMTLRLDKDLPITAAYYRQLGVFARDALGRLASQCQKRVWICHIFELLELDHLVRDPLLVDPRPIPDPPPLLDSIDLENVALGAAIHAMAVEFGDASDAQRLVEEAPEKVEDVVRRGAADGVAQLFERAQEGMRSSEEAVRRLNEIRP